MGTTRVGRHAQARTSTHTCTATLAFDVLGLTGFLMAASRDRNDNRVGIFTCVTMPPLTYGDSPVTLPMLKL